MAHTVGIIGINGHVGRPTVRYLLQAAQEGKINLIVLTREGKAPEDVVNASQKNSDSIELRIIKAEGSDNDLNEAVAGINTFISTMGGDGRQFEIRLVEALSRSPNAVTFIPSSFSKPWSDSEAADARLSPVIKWACGPKIRAAELNVGVTTVYTGAFDIFIFQYGFLGSPVKDNCVMANDAQMRNGLPVTALEHLGQALMRIASADPNSIKNREYSVVTFWPTGKDLVDIYTKLNKSPARVKNYTEADHDAFRNDTEGLGLVKASYFEHWSSNDFGYGDHGRTRDEHYQGPTIETLAQGFLQ